MIDLYILLCLIYFVFRYVIVSFGDFLFLNVNVDILIVILSSLFLFFYYRLNYYKEDKKQVGNDVCIVPIVAIIIAGVLSYYLEDSYSFLSFLTCQVNWSYFCLPKDDSSILTFLTPHIAACVGWVTFWAFWSQIKANALTVENFEKQQITEQYFEMMKMHLDNVKGFSFKFKKYPTVPGFRHNYKTVRGIEIFDSLREHYEITFKEVKREIYALILGDSERKIAKNFAADHKYSSLFSDDKLITISINTLASTKRLWFQLQISILKSTYYFIYEHNIELDKDPSSPLPPYDSSKNKFIIKLPSTYGLGYKNQLTHYYRNLFRAVKFIANQDEDLFNYEEKRKKLGMLRSQMNNSEQLMLFYNWISSYGEQWENAWKKEKNNKFLTDYRMIHNLHYKDLNNTIFKDIKGVKVKKHLLEYLFNNLTEILGDGSVAHYEARNEDGKFNDHLFEFIDWEEE